MSEERPASFRPICSCATRGAQLEATEERLVSDLATAREDLVVSDIHSRLGLLVTTVRQSDFEAARELSTQLYDETEGALLVVADADAKRRLQTLAQTRDEVTAALALNEPQALDTLERSVPAPRRVAVTV